MAMGNFKNSNLKSAVYLASILKTIYLNILNINRKKKKKPDIFRKISVSSFKLKGKDYPTKF